MNGVHARVLCGLTAGLIVAGAHPAYGQGSNVVEKSGSADASGTATRTIKTKARESKIDRYARVLGFDDTQTQVARDLMSVHDRASAEAGKKMRDAMRDAQNDINDGDRSAFEKKIQKVMKEQKDETDTLTKQFLTDLKSVLRPDQEGNWVKLERLRRREKMLGGMMHFGNSGVGGGNVDLVTLIGRVDIPGASKPKVDELLGQYEVDVDRPLQERERNFEDDQKAMGAVQQFSPDTFQKKLERDRAVDMKVREVNDRFVRLIGGELPQDVAAKFDDDYRARAYRSIYRPTTAAKELASAEKLKGLTAQQREKLKAMSESYARDIKAANDKWAAATRRAEDDGKATGNGPMMFMGPGHGEEIDPLVADARAQRRALDAALRDQLEKTLSPEQLADARDAAKPQGGAVGRRVEVFGDGAGEDMVFTSDIEFDDDEMAEGGEGGAIMIIQTVEDHGPGGAPPPPPPPQPK